MLEGIAAGFILSLALFPGTVWLVKVGMVGNAFQVLMAALGFVLSQLFWLSISALGLFMMMKYLNSLRPMMHLFATIVLFYMSFKLIRSRRVEVLDDAGELPSLKILFRNAFNRSLAMPMRLPTAMAILLATGVYTNNPLDREIIGTIILGSCIGVVWWWTQLSVLTVFFVRRVPAHITVHSLNKIRPFCASLLILTGFISLLILP